MMKTQLFLGLLLTLVACAPHPANVPVRPEALSFPELKFEFPQVERATLKNGVEVYLKADHDLPLVEVTP